MIEEAEAVADEVGLPRLTLAAVAVRLGVRLPSLYKHVDGMDALQRLMSIRAKSELGAVLARAAVGLSGAAALAHLCSAYRAWAQEHPGRYATTVTAPVAGDDEDLAASTEVVGVVFAVLTGYGLDEHARVDATRALRSALHGFLVLEEARGFGLPQDVDRSFDALVAAFDRALATWPKTPD